jgi:hypothetical protein
MSLFRVKLVNEKQGKMSVGQRSAYIMGPNKVNRILKDGDTFRDCNYWKRFAYPQVPLEDAFIEVLEDDGIQYLDNQNNNFPKVYNITVEPESSFDQNEANILEDTGGYAYFTQITNRSETNLIKIKLNNSSEAIFDLPAGSTQNFDAGDVSISSIKIENDTLEQIEVQILVSIMVVPKS